MNNFHSQLIQDAGSIARSAGELILTLSSQERQISFKSARDMVTEVDQASEKYIVSEINRLYPEHEILAEEGSGSEVDPIPWTLFLET